MCNITSACAIMHKASTRIIERDATLNTVRMHSILKTFAAYTPVARCRLGKYAVKRRTGSWAAWSKAEYVLRSAHSFSKIRTLKHLDRLLRIPRRRFGAAACSAVTS